MSENTVLTNASTGAVVNPEETVTMWLGDVSVQVPKSSIGDFQGKGFLLVSKDGVPSIVSEIEALVPNLVASAKRYVEGLEVDGYVDNADTAELVVLQKVWGLVSDKLNNLITVTGQLYPARQGTPAVMLNAEGNKVSVDPSQVDHYVAQGWKALND